MRAQPDDAHARLLLIRARQRQAQPALADDVVEDSQQAGRALGAYAGEPRVVAVDEDVVEGRLRAVARGRQFGALGQSVSRGGGELVPRARVEPARRLQRVHALVDGRGDRVGETLRHLAAGRGAHRHDVLEREVEHVLGAAVAAAARHDGAHLPEHQRVVEQLVEELGEVEGHVDHGLPVEVRQRQQDGAVVGRRLQAVHVLVAPVALAAELVERHDGLVRATREQAFARLPLVSDAAQLLGALLGYHAPRHCAEWDAGQLAERREEPELLHLGHLACRRVDAAILRVERQEVGHEHDLVRHVLCLHLHPVADHGDELAVGDVGELGRGELEIQARALWLRRRVEQLDVAGAAPEVPETASRPRLDRVLAEGDRVRAAVRRPPAAVPLETRREPRAYLVERPALDDVSDVVWPEAVLRRRLALRRRQGVGGEVDDRGVAEGPERGVCRGRWWRQGQ